MATQQSKDKIFRNLEFRLYPNDSQQQKLRWLKEWHRRLYNHLRHHQIWAYRDRSKVTDRVELPEGRTFISLNAHRNYLTGLRNASPEELNLKQPDNPYSPMNAESLQVQAERVHKAFRAFFRRVQDPEKTNPGFPRYKTANRFKSIGFKTNGWQLGLTRHSPYDRRRQDLAREFLASEVKNGYLQLQGVGWMQVRGQIREALRKLFADQKGRVKQLTVKEKRDGWYLFLKVELDELPARKHGEDAAGMDWGVSEFGTLALEGSGAKDSQDGQHQWAVLDVNEVFDHLAGLQKKMDQLKSCRDKRKQRGSSAWRRLNDRVATLAQKIARTRKDTLHKITATLVEKFALLAVETGDIKGLTASGRGTEENPGTNVRQKAALNRSILNRSPGQLFRQLACKAEEAGCKLKEIDPREASPTRTCHVCGEKNPMELEDRIFRCLHCGVEADRDYSAARVVLNLGLFGVASFQEAGLMESAGRGPARCGGASGEPPSGVFETPSVKHKVQVGGSSPASAPQ